MIKYNFKLALRNLWKNKIFSFINIFGLAFGLTCCLLMILFIRNELNFEKFNSKADKVYRIAFSDYQKQGSYATTPLPIGAALKEQMPEIKAMTRVTFTEDYLVKYELNQGFEPMNFADEAIFNIFSFPLVEGDANTALKDPNSIAISERMAKKYFGNVSPLNKMLKIGSTGKMNCTVKAVFKDLPQNSHLQFNNLVSFATLEKIGSPTTLWRQMPGNYTYVQLNDHADAQKLDAKLKDFVDKNIGEELKSSNNTSYSLMLQPLSSIHLQSHLKGERPGEGNMAYVYLFAAIAIIILLIACINFINFATAHAIKRVKEIGVRKVLGAMRWQLTKQFLAQSIILYLFATGFALLLAKLLMPVFNEVSGHAFVFADIMEPLPLAGIVAIGIISGMIAGFFPAWSISRYSSVEALKGKISGSFRQSAISKMLITFQFSASLILIIAAVVVYQQMQFVRKEASVNKTDQLIVFRMNGKLAEKNELLKTELLANNNISNVSVAANVPGFSGDGWPIMLTENSPEIPSENYVADDHYLETMGMPLVAGRKLDASNATDVKENFVINETAVNALGFPSPQEAIGKQLLWGGDEKKKGSIVGVVKDFHITSLHEKIAPAVIQFAPYEWMTYSFMLVKLKPQNISNSIDFIKKTAAGIDANWLVECKFFDDNFAAMHKKDQQQGEIFAAFAVIAVLISALGLLGLTIYATQKRIKEIGIRKILGAGTGSILALLSKDFALLILLAAVVSFPVAWWLMNTWLEDFAYRINISWTVFLIAGLSVLLVSVLTVSFQAIKAAIANPVNSLRSE